MYGSPDVYPISDWDQVESVQLITAQSDLRKKSRWRDRRHGQFVKIVVGTIIVAMAKRMNAAIGKIERTVDDVAADHVAFVQKNLGAEKSH